MPAVFTCRYLATVNKIVLYLLNSDTSKNNNFYNYKDTYSIILMAVAGTDNECLYADNSAKDRCSDEGIWSNSKLEDWKKKTGRKYSPDSWSENVDEHQYYKTIIFGYGWICNQIMPREILLAKRTDCGGTYLQLETQQHS